MNLRDFRIGSTSTLPKAAGDAQTSARVMAAIKLDQSGPSWYNGPPYGVAEIVFDEYDLEACAIDQSEL